MRVKKIEIKNLKAIQEANIDLNGSHIIVMGKNAVGKSTIGRIVQDLLSKNEPAEPLKKGEKEGFCKIELSDGSIIYYKFDEFGRKLSVISSDGIELNSSSIIKKLTGKGFSFDIDEFLRMTPKKQKDTLLSLSGLDVSEIEQEYKKAYDDRTEANMKLKTQQARIKPYDISLVGKEKVDIAKLTEKYKKAVDFNAEYEDYLNKSVNLNSKIQDLRKELAILEQKANDYKTYFDTHKKLEDNHIKEIQEQISQAEITNDKITNANLLHKEFELAEQYEMEAVEANDIVKEVEARKHEIISKADLPSGIKLSENGLEIDGLPFNDNQIATSRKMIAALEIAEKMLGELRYLHFDASILDRENAQKIIEWANRKDLQLCLERAIWDGEELTYEIIEK